MAYYGGGYGMGGMLPALQVNPVGLGAENAERITQQQQNQVQLQQEQALAPLEVAAKQQELQNEQELSPLELAARKQDLQTQTAASKTTMVNSQMAEVARQASAADPADAPRIWDQGMKGLQAQGIDIAGRYVGHYRHDLAQSVSDIFGTEPSARAGRDQANALNPDPGLLVQRMSALPQAALAQIVQRQNSIIEGYNRLGQNYSQQSLDAELATLKQAGVPVDQILGPNPKLTTELYGKISQLLDGVRSTRNAASQVLMQSATGAPIVPPMATGAGSGFAISGYNAEGSPVFYRKNNPMVTMTGTPGQQKTPGGPASVQRFDTMRAAWIAMHPGDDEGALEFANGQKKVQPGELMNMAMTRANQEFSDLALNATQIDNPQAWIKQRTQENFQAMQAAGAGAQPGNKPAAGPGPKRTPGQISQSLNNARAAIKAGWPRAAVIQKLQAAGVPTQGL